MKEIIKENIKPAIFIFIVLVLTAISAYPQLRLSGKVTEILDGKTVMIEMPNGRLKVVLQYIEVPEPEQQLHQIVKDHLQKLVLGKNVEVLPNGTTSGQVFLGRVNISQQMIRDGAAWFNAAESSLQTSAERQIYIDTESQAKAEKRGVWGVEGLKPAWEFRAEKAKAEKEKIEAQRNEQKQLQLPQKKPSLSAEERARQASANVEIWAELPEPKTSGTGVKTVSNNVLIDDADKEAVNAESHESLLKMGEISSAIANEFALTYKNSTNVYDYSKLEKYIDSIDKGVDAVKGNFKNQKNLAKLKEIQQIAQDVRAILKIMDKKNAAVYKGDLVKLSTRYGVKPTIDASGEEVIEKQAILRTIFKLMKDDFDYLKTNTVTGKKV